jgi:hypothetical protein
MYFTERWKRDRLDRCLGEVDAARHSSSGNTRALAAAMHAQGSCASLARRLVQRSARKQGFQSARVLSGPA